MKAEEEKNDDMPPETDKKIKHMEFHAKSPEIPQVPAMLHPDHPLLEKFQKALREHLEMQINQLTEQIFELETEAKKKKTAHEQLGVEGYEAQQVVAKQHAELEARISDYQSTNAAREQMEHELDVTEKKYKDVSNQLLEAERKEIQLRNEVEAVNFLLHQMGEWEDDVEGEMMVNQRIFEKTRKDKLKLAEEKRRQDLFVYGLTTEVWRLESEIEDIEMQLRVKEAEKDRLNETIAQCNIDIEAFDTEYRCLLHAWNSVIVAIGARDRGYANVKQELDAVNEQIRTTINEIDQVKKACQKEMESNELLTMSKQRIAREIKMCQSHIDEENTKRYNLEKQMAAQQAVIDQLNHDLEVANAENNRKRALLNAEMREFDKINVKKMALEEEILKKLQDQLTSDNLAKHTHKLLRKFRQKNKETEITLKSSENDLTKLIMETETQKLFNDDLNRLLRDLRKEQDAAQAQANKYAEELKRCSLAMDKKEATVGIIAKKIEREIAKSGSVEVSVQEKKLIALEQSLEEARDKNVQLQRVWLREQGHMIALAEQRQDQLQQLNLFRKQIMVLEQKNLKIGDEIDSLRKQEDIMNRNINKLRNQIVVSNEKISRKRGSKLDMERSNEYLKQDFFSRLQDAELECLKLEETIANIEEEKQNLSEQLLQMNRETLAWEKKLQMAVETKTSVHKEKKEGGEIGNMKAEIHRMNIRHSQLKKAQEKLIQDLEHCVSRRDAIFTTSTAREIRSKDGQGYTKVAVQRKLNNLQNTITQTEKEIETIRKKIQEAEGEEERANENVEHLKTDIENYKDKIKQLEDDIQRLKMHKQLQLELLVLKQKRLKVYQELAKGRKPFVLYKNENAAETEYNKQTALNGQLQKICESLISDFPSHYITLTHFYNMLKLHYLEAS